MGGLYAGEGPGVGGKEMEQRRSELSPGGEMAAQGYIGVRPGLAQHKARLCKIKISEIKSPTQSQEKLKYSSSETSQSSK